MDNIYKYSEKYPNLILEILEYFKLDGNLMKKNVYEFCLIYKVDKNTGSMKYNPEHIVKICEKLVSKNRMQKLVSKGPMGIYNTYTSSINWDSYGNLMNFRHILANHFNCLVYGKQYVYNLYKNIVLPILYTDKDNNISVGTGFLYADGLVTARHCIEGAKNIAIKGITKEQLENSDFFVHVNENIDLAFITLPGVHNPVAMQIKDSVIMNEIIVMGYPKIPGFTDFLTAEKATVSSKADSRITPTTGSVAASAFNIFAKQELLLITAKIKGGNSGGPVIDEEGNIVGIACQMPDSEGKLYDDLGYGVAVPSKYIAEIRNSRQNKLDKSKIEFTNFE